LPICLCHFGFAGCGAQKQVSSFSQAVAISAPLNIKKVAPKENELQR
jgi:hypothetical protein